MGLPAIVPIWQYHAVESNGDGWRYLFSQDADVGQGWTLDGVAFSAFASGEIGDPVYQYHAVQANGDGWRYTFSLDPNLGQGWTLDGVAWYGFSSAVPQSVSIYQYYAVQADGDGLRYTFSTNPSLGSGWTLDGVAFYCLPIAAASGTDYGAQIAAPGNISISPSPAYGFGVGDFSVTALFRTLFPGTLVSRKSTAGGQGAGGWLVVLGPAGTIEFATDNGFGFYEVASGSTNALDGEWHHVAAVRRSGQLEIWLDGVSILVEPTSNLATPLDVSTGIRVLIGGTDQEQEPYNQFVGTIEDVTIWSDAIGTSQITESMFNLLTGQESGLVGFWPMDRSLADLSPTANTGTVNGNVSFVPVFHATWVQNGANAFSFASLLNSSAAIGGLPSAESATTGVAANGSTTVTRAQQLQVPPGAPYLFMCISDPDQVQFPTGAQVSVQGPDGTSYDQSVDTASLFVCMSGSSLWYMTVVGPAQGVWTATITAPDSTPFRFWFHTLPAADVVQTMLSELGPVYGAPSPSTLALGDPILGWALIIGGIGLGAIAVIACTNPITAGAAYWAGAAAALAISAGAAQVWAESAHQAALTPGQAAEQAAITAGFVADGAGKPSLAQVWNKAQAKVGDPATTDPQQFASRADLGVDATYYLHLDLGGEGPFIAYDIPSGFDSAINLNVQTKNSQNGAAIPMLIHLLDWTADPLYPFQDHTINYITIQGAPLTQTNVTEIARLLIPGGKVGLWIALDQHPTAQDSMTNLQRAQQLATMLNSTLQISCAGPDALPPGMKCDAACVDEVEGKYPMTKVCIVDKRAPIPDED